MEEGKVFTAKHIKSKKDWPTVKGRYFCNINGFDTICVLDPDLPEKSYMRNVRWYLTPYITPY